MLQAMPENLASMGKLIKLVLMITLIPSNSLGQCTNQVVHLKGSKTINGISVTVNSSGVVDSFPNYCKTFPYFIGQDSSSVNGDGFYTFNFTPAINSVTLNFSGISLSAKHKEEIVLYVNDKHYRIPSAGGLTDCEPMAVLNSNGNINGCFDCSVSGWYGTTISGPIYNLTVLDSVISGTPNGTIFSLFICESASISIGETHNKTLYKFFPNPLVDQSVLNFPNALQNSIFKLYNPQGNLINTIINSTNGQIKIERGNLTSGLYYFTLQNKQTVVGRGKLEVK